MKTIEWRDNAVRIIDQTRLPQELVYIRMEDASALRAAIKKLQVRGAPALGAAAALGVYLALRGSKAKDAARFAAELEKAIRYMGSARPTARNLFYGLERVRRAVRSLGEAPVSVLKERILIEAKAIIEEDMAACRQIGRYGARLLKDRDTVLTVCNAGILATIDYGTALGVIYRAREEGKDVKVYACETRPLLQGARLTTWELRKKGIEVTLICDNMAASLMKKGLINKVITGADRIAANGDAANKIGTYNLAVLSRYHNVPFYIAAPRSTFDLKTSRGALIPIEERQADEVTTMFFKRPIAASGTKVYNPAFDVTDHNLITAFITDGGIIRPPYARNIRAVLGKALCV